MMTAQVFAPAAFFYISYASGLEGLPPVTNAATDHGFAGLNVLQGPKATDSTGAGDEISEGSYFDLFWGF